MTILLDHPIVYESFALIDREVGPHDLNASEYEIVRRVIHSTADFEFLELVRWSEGAIAAGIKALIGGQPLVVDVTMVRQGILRKVAQTFQNPIVTALDFASEALPGKTRTETGLLRCLADHPQGIYGIGNAPTALLALCDAVAKTGQMPPLVIGVPVGFVQVVEAKQRLIESGIPSIYTQGRKGGSPVAAAIINALLTLAWNEAQALL